MRNQSFFCVMLSFSRNILAGVCKNTQYVFRTLLYTGYRVIVWIETVPGERREAYVDIKLQYRFSEN